MLPISMFSMNCSFNARSILAAWTSCSPAWAVIVIVSVSILTTWFKSAMLTIVPVDAAQGVSEWLLPKARTGLGYRVVSRRIACSSSTLFGCTYSWGVVTIAPS